MNIDVRPRPEILDKTETREIAEALKDGLRSLAKAVAVITCEHEGQRYAMTATAISELSMDPPSMLVCVNKTASLYEPLSHGADFCINILCAEQSEISNMCSGKAKGESRFTVGSWLGSPLGPPYLEDAQANIFCRNVSKNFEHGTHNIFIGEVEQVLRRELAKPLVYMDGRYGEFASA
ncbi:flavin reductase family protein [Hyphococcus luteus]|uniref:Flavin reductase n=1 Tax=Hyphococcus luteus TaxID=2058213 RepID=A0A2S7K1T8_9PROT|nr:flavin reductase family protein [Marinicaulis flavus]PQA86398.1 flavin reductase [Marinicaulis flavus]